ncbi:MAG: hypothetical protein JWN34_6050, partial [Bryobacterales bacterium]|nr:hypothetical protein [Bryobacterales bacterium]
GRIARDPQIARRWDDNPKLGEGVNNVLRYKGFEARVTAHNEPRLLGRLSGEPRQRHKEALRVRFIEPDNREFSVKCRHLISCHGIAVGLALRNRWMPGKFVADLKVEFDTSCGYP